MRIKLETGTAEQVADIRERMQRNIDAYSEYHHSGGPFDHINADVVRRPLMIMRPVRQEIGSAVMDVRGILRASFE